VWGEPSSGVCFSKNTIFVTVVVTADNFSLDCANLTHFIRQVLESKIRISEEKMSIFAKVKSIFNTNNGDNKEEVKEPAPVSASAAVPRAREVRQGSAVRPIARGQARVVNGATVAPDSLPPHSNLIVRAYSDQGYSVTTHRSPPHNQKMKVNAAALPKFPYSKPELSPKEDESEVKKDQCTVCMCEYSEGEEIRLLPCLHRYHASCIDPWFDQHTTCPVCNVDVLQLLSAASNYG
jgi:hypothetical protein